MKRPEQIKVVHAIAVKIPEVFLVTSCGPQPGGTSPGHAVYDVHAAHDALTYRGE